MRSSIGRVAVSKTVGCEFDPHRTCMKVLIILSLILTSLTSYCQDELYNVIESDIVEKFNDDGIYYVRENTICYLSKVKKNFRRETIEIETDSIKIRLFILQKMDYQTKGVYYSALAAKGNQVFHIKEFFNRNYYLISIPIRMTHVAGNLGGFGKELIISNKAHDCDSIRNLSVTYRHLKITKYRSNQKN